MKSPWPGVFPVARKLVALVGVFLCAFPLAAQSPQSAPSSQPAVHVSTGLVLVDVVAMGKNGKPVSGLTAKDFRVLEDGKPQTVAVFREEGGQVSATPASQPPLPEFTYTNSPVYHPATGPLTIVLLDALNTPIFSQDRARMAVIRYLAKLLKQKRPIAILALTDHLTVLQNFTTSRTLLLDAANKFTPQESNQMGLRTEMTSKAKDDEYLNVLQMAQGCQCQAMVDFYQSLKAMDRHNLTISDEQRAALTAQAFADIANALAGYPGRKNLVWLSEAFPSVYPGGPKQKFAWSLEDKFHHVADMLNQARVAVYPVDARGLTTDIKPGPDEVEWTEIQMGSQYESTADQYMDWYRQVRSPMYNLFTSQLTMRSVAAATGGVAFYNSNDLPHAIADAAADSSDSYLLGYYPTNQDWNGKFRRITLKTGEPGLHLRYRQGYYALPGFSAQPAKLGKTVKQQIQDALLDPLPPTGVVFRVQAPPPTPASRGVVQGQIILPASSIKLGDSCNLNISFRVAALTSAGKIAAERGNDLKRQLPSKECAGVRKGNLGFHFELALKPGLYQVEFLARDNRTGAIGRVDMPVEISAP